MLKFFLLLLTIISPNLSAYQSLKKYYGFDNIKDKDDVCSFTYSSVTYVKPCEQGKYCQNFGGISLCVDEKKIVSKKTIGQTCSHTNECINGLYCDNTCKSTCQNNERDFINSWGSYSCKKSNIQDGLYYSIEFDNNGNPKTSTEITNDIDIFRVGGKIHFHQQKQSDNSYHYYEEKKELAYIGTVKDNEFVDNPLACSSGFAIKLYPDGTLKDPSTTFRNSKYYKCVTVKDVVYDNIGSCYIKYGDNDEIYFNNEIYGTCNEYLLTKLNLFKKYIEVYTPDKQKSCDKSENYNEPLTCNDDEVRKWYYFYTKPEDYLLYYNEKDDKGTDITTYLIKQYYNSYQSASILNIKYIILLLFLLSL